MVNLIQGIAGGLVGRLAAKILRAESTGDQPPFAQILAESMSSADVREVRGIADCLLDLPITSDEARQIAAELFSLVGDLKARGGADARTRVAEFAANVSRRFMLSEKDAASLKGFAENYTARELLTGLPV